MLVSQTVTTFYCDGSSSLKSGYCGWATAGHPVGVELLKPYSQTLGLCIRAGYYRGTNQVGELLALLAALQMLPEAAKAHIITDSEYAIKCCGEYRRKWVQNGFRNYVGEEVKNLQLLNHIWRYLDVRDILFHHVRGHQGNAGNEFVDTLSRDARYQGEGRLEKVENPEILKEINVEDTSMVLYDEVL